MDFERQDQCIRVVLGHDARAPIGYHVCEQNIMKHSSLPVTISALSLPNLRNIFTRPKDPTQLTDFSYSRFLTPFLWDYKGWAIFMDGTDMLLREDLKKLWALRDNRFAVMVVKHRQLEGKKHSFMGKEIETYPMFNWSSVMLMNNAKCTALTPEYVNSAKYLDLHQFKWLENEGLIGELPPIWNHLVGYYSPNPDAAIVHWTSGAPYQGEEFGKTEHAEEWFKAHDNLLRTHLRDSRVKGWEL